MSSLSLVQSKDPAKTIETLLNLVRHSEKAYRIKAISNGYAILRLEIEFEDGVRYDIAGSQYSNCVEVFGPAPFTAYITELKVGDTTLATRAFDSEKARADFIEAAPPEVRELFINREEILN